MGVDTDSGVGLGVLRTYDLVFLNKGDLLLYSCGVGENLLAATVTVVEVFLDKERCRVKVEAIVKQGQLNEASLGDIIYAIPGDLSKP